MIFFIIKNNSIDTAIVNTNNNQNGVDQKIFIFQFSICPFLFHKQCIVREKDN